MDTTSAPQIGRFKDLGIGHGKTLMVQTQHFKVWNMTVEPKTILVYYTKIRKPRKKTF